MYTADLLNDKHVQKPCICLEKFLETNIHTAIILGSFLSQTTDSLPLSAKREISMGGIPKFLAPTVTGHKKSLVCGHLYRKNIIIFGRRCHYYEGYSIYQIVFPVILAKKFNTKHLITTNSASGLNLDFREDELMLIEDNINMLSGNPLFGYSYNQDYHYFLDMSRPYSEKQVAACRLSASKAGINPNIGVYAGLKGPVLETRAEAAMLKKMGTGVVGRSTIAKAIMANFLKIEVLEHIIYKEPGIWGQQGV